MFVTAIPFIGSLLQGLTLGSPAKHQARRGGRMQAAVRLSVAGIHPMLLMGHWCRGNLLPMPLLAIGQGVCIMVLGYCTRGLWWKRMLNRLRWGLLA